MGNEIYQILKYNSESETLDFKSTEYPLGNHPKKHELLKDMMAMVNHPSNDTKYIFIGVEEKEGKASNFFDINELTDQSKYQQFLNEYIEPNINFEYKSIEYDGTKLGVFIISGNTSRPYLFKKSYKKKGTSGDIYKIGDGLIRTGTSTRKMNRRDFEMTYSHRFEESDRKDDIKVTPVFKSLFGSEPIEETSYFLLDIMVENTGTKSIGFDVDLRIYHRRRFRVIKKYDWDNQFEDQGLSSINPQYFPPKVDPTLGKMVMEKFNDFTKITGNKLRFEEYEMGILQKDKLESLFEYEILIIANDRNIPVPIELTLRSDSFIDGPLKFKTEVDLNSVT